MTGRNIAWRVASAMARASSGRPDAIAARAASTSSGCGSPTSAIARASASTEGGRTAAHAMGFSEDPRDGSGGDGGHGVQFAVGDDVIDHAVGEGFVAPHDVV